MGPFIFNYFLKILAHKQSIALMQPAGVFYVKFILSENTKVTGHDLTLSCYSIFLTLYEYSYSLLIYIKRNFKSIIAGITNSGRNKDKLARSAQCYGYGLKKIIENESDHELNFTLN